MDKNNIKSVLDTTATRKDKFQMNAITTGENGLHRAIEKYGVPKQVYLDKP